MEKLHPRPTSKHLHPSKGGSGVSTQSFFVAFNFKPIREVGCAGAGWCPAGLGQLGLGCGKYIGMIALPKMLKVTYSPTKDPGFC